MCRKSIGFHLSRLVTLLENLESHLNTWNLFCTWNYTLKTEASANNTIITLCQSNRTKILGTLITVFFPAQNFRFSFAIDLAIYWENLDLHPYPLHAGTQARTHARTHAHTHMGHGHTEKSRGWWELTLFIFVLPLVSLVCCQWIYVEDIAMFILVMVCLIMKDVLIFVRSLINFCLTFIKVCTLKN